MKIIAFVASCLTFWATAATVEESTVYEEISRLKSSDNMIEVVVSKGNVGATVSTPYKVFAVPVGRSLDDVAPLFFADKTNPPDVIWIDSQTISISCDNARVWQYRNFTYLSHETGDLVLVSVVLRCGTDGYYSN